METIVIGKPAINVYLPLQEFPQEGDLFLIKNKNESVGNVGATSACLFAKWKMSVNFTGVVGNDAYAEKIRDTFKTFKVNSKYLETNYETGTAVNYDILNVKTGIVTKILFNDFDKQLTKYKYDFIPGFAIIDGTDFAGAHALINNNGSVKSVFYGRIGDKDSIAMSKRCSWSVVTEKFVNMMTKEESDGSAEGYVNLYQKIVDIGGHSNYIVILNSHKILYCVDGKVKMLPESKINIVDSSSFDSVFVGALSYGLANEISLDDSIKLANTAAAISLTKIGEVDAIPEFDDVLDNSGLREKLGMAKKTVTEAAPAEVQPLNPNVGVEQSTNAPVQDNTNVAFGGSTAETPQVSQAPSDNSQMVAPTPAEMPTPVENTTNTTNV